MTVDVTIAAAVLAGIASFLLTLRFLDWWASKPTFRELSRYSDDALEQYAERRDALADADPDFLTDYARRVALWQQIKGEQA